MPLPPASQFQFTPDLRICRLLNGMWQVSGAHGRIDPQAALQNMLHYHDAGFTTWDLADHYGPAEDFIGEFRRQLAATRGPAALDDHAGVYQMGAATRAYDPAYCGKQCRHLTATHGRGNAGSLQFHWWDYEDSAYLDALTHLLSPA